MVVNLFRKNISELIVSSEKVAHVHMDHSLEHALLVLIKTRYSAIPVVDSSFKLKGLISTTLILDSILGIERIETELLADKVVAEVMNSKAPSMKENESFSKGLKLLIDYPFLCITNEEGIFTGILTRRTVMKFMNRYLHERKRESVRPT